MTNVWIDRIHPQQVCKPNSGTSSIQNAIAQKLTDGKDQTPGRKLEPMERDKRILNQVYKLT